MVKNAWKGRHVLWVSGDKHRSVGKSNMTKRDSIHKYLFTYMSIKFYF